MASSIEAVFNNEFAKLLSEVSRQSEGWIPAEKEKLLEGSNERPDMLLDRPGLPPFIIEAKFAESHQDPTVDVGEKLGQVCSSENRYVAGLTVKSGAALRYPTDAKYWTPEKMRKEFLDGKAELEWKLATRINGENDILPSKGWIKGDIYDFWASISRTALNTEEIKTLGKTVAKHIKAAAKNILSVLKNHTEEQQRIAADMGEPEDVKAGMEIACVVWLDALLMMNELAREGKKLRPDLKTVKPASLCRTKTGLPSVSQIEKEWSKVLGDNYESIFKPARTALPQTVPHSDLSSAFGFLMEAAEEIESARLGKIANIGGEIFARVMDSQQRKNTASFYTKPQVAEFLAALTVPSEDVLPSDWKEWKLADFACGTGSLLRAGYRLLTGFAARKNIDIHDFHKHMMETNLYGLDVSSIAAHLSATTIVNLFPAISYDNMQIGPVEFGVKNGTAYAGSLEIADSKTDASLFNENFVSLKGDTDSEEGVARIGAADSSFAAVIMNPPYSRTGGGQAVADMSGVSDEERKRIQKRISVLRKKTLGNGKAGLASDFIDLAAQKLADGGRMGFVLPLTFAAAGSYLKIRDYLTENFSDITLIFFAGGVQGVGESLSDDTSIEEIMLVGTKGRKGRKGIRYVKLDSPFSSASQALETAREVWNTETEIAKGEMQGVVYIGADRAGEWLLVPKTRSGWSLAGASDLHGFAAAAEFLAGGTATISDTKIEFPVAQLSDLLEIGPTHHNIGFMAKVFSKGQEREGWNCGAFRLHQIESPRDALKQDVSLWHAKHDKCLSVYVAPTHYGTEYDSSKTENMRRTRTDLFIQRYMGWTSQKTLAGRTEKTCLGGNAWTGLSHDDAVIKDAFTIWANSIFGFVAYWAQSQRQHQGRSHMRIGDLTRMLAPDFSDTDMRARAAAVLAEIDTESLFSGMLDRAYFCENDSHRQKFNKAAAAMLGIPADKQDSIIAYLQRAWTDEPSVTPGK